MVWFKLFIASQTSLTDWVNATTSLLISVAKIALLGRGVNVCATGGASVTSSVFISGRVTVVGVAGRSSSVSEILNKLLFDTCCGCC